MYLLMMVAAVFAEFYVRSNLIVYGNAAETARNIMASERLFRISIACDLITFTGGVVPVVALYVLLKPVNQSLALLAAFWRLAESAILGVIMLKSAFSYFEGNLTSDHAAIYHPRRWDKVILVL